MEEDYRTLLSRLEITAKTEVSNVFHGTGDTNIPLLCSDINRAVLRFLDDGNNANNGNGAPVDMDVLTLCFLKFSLPTLVEILFRRTTLRYTMLMNVLHQILYQII